MITLVMFILWTSLLSDYKYQSLNPPFSSTSNRKQYQFLPVQLILAFELSLLGHILHTTKMSLIPSFFGGRKTNVFDPFSLDIWDPFDGFFVTSPSVANWPSSARETAAVATARIDWKETPEAHVFKADVPGLKKEELKVEVEEGRILQISGERSKEQEEKNDKWHRSERRRGKFLRRFRLPENAKVEEVKASLEDGVLTVTVPKVEEKKPEVKSIEISA
ncbi:17.4 kDa class I heat shock protein-like [Coffea arabica]|uniref:17.4 kDa class I heat shock protein-like n=1 Tax=Coffea arabica TaxID=13443 RepID=A0A6P6VZA3_COFAR|nr:17.4 kDa class I heat shock protein-like [Coffea arabica]